MTLHQAAETRTLTGRVFLSWAFLVLPCSIVAAALMRLLIRANVEVPMVDDWFLVQWGTKLTAHAAWKDYWATVNGHQLILEKLYVKALGRFASLSLVDSAIIAVSLVALSAILILWTLPERRGVSFLVFSIGFSTLLLNVRQMQNFFLLICLMWVMGLFAIALFVALHRDGEARGLRWAAAVCTMFLSSLIGGFGIVLPLYATGAYLLDVRRRRAQAAIIVPVAAFSVFLAMIYPRWLGTYSGPPVLDLEFVLRSPLNAARMFLISIGQPFVPWNASAASAALSFGLVAVVACAYLIGRSLLDRRFPQFVFENPLIIIGLLFSVIIVVTRGKLVGVLSALELRYTTAAVLIWAGLLVCAWRRFDRRRWIVSAFAVVLGVIAHVDGSESGLQYLDAHRRHSAVVSECFESVNWELAAACVDLAYPGPFIDRKMFEASNRALFEERKAFYTHRGEAEAVADSAPGAAHLVSLSSVSKGAVDLTWTYTGNARNFRIMRRARAHDSWYVISDVPGEWRSFHNEPLPTCAKFAYRIVPLSETEDATPSNESIANTPCSAPSTLTATAISDSRIDLHWSDDQASQGFRVVRREPQSGWYVITELGGQARSLTNAPLAPCTEFSYRVFAITASGSSPPSNEASAKTTCRSSAVPGRH